MTDLHFQTPLDEDTLRALSIPAPWGFGIADRVRFGELDVLAHVNNTTYLRWLENFRISYFREYGVADYRGQFPRIVLRQIGMDFLAEMTLGQDYVITGRTASLRQSSFRMDYAVWAGGRCRATGWAVLVWLTDDGQKAPIPAAVRETFITRDGAEAA
ncbi:MAG: thioesterase family protein [Pseudomonadota bacterium]